MKHTARYVTLTLECAYFPKAVHALPVSKDPCGSTSAPETHAPDRCLDGCPVEKSCPYHALKQYIDPGFPKIPMSLLTGVPLQAFID